MSAQPNTADLVTASQLVEADGFGYNSRTVDNIAQALADQRAAYEAVADAMERKGVEAMCSAYDDSAELVRQVGK